MTFLFVWVLPKHGFPLSLTPLLRGVQGTQLWGKIHGCTQTLWFWRVAWQQKSLPAWDVRLKRYDKSIGVKMTEGMHCFVIFMTYQFVTYTSYMYIVYIACNPLILTIDLIYLDPQHPIRSIEREDGPGGPLGTPNEWRSSWYIGAVDQRHLLTHGYWWIWCFHQQK